MPKLNKEVVMGVIVDETITYTLTEISEYYDLETKLLQEMLEHGLITPQRTPQKHELCIDLDSLKRIQTALHLHQDLGINIPGTVLILEMMNEIDLLHHKLDIFQRHFGKL